MQIQHTLPFRSKKKMADAMVRTVEDQVAGDGGWIDGTGCYADDS